MHNKIVLIFFLLLVFDLSVKAQEKGFLFSYTDTNHSWMARDAVETPAGDFVIGIRDDWGNEARLIKLSSDGSLLGEQPIVAEDTTVFLSRVFSMSDGQSGDFLAICPCEPLDGSRAALMFVRFDEDLNITSRKVVECPFMEPGDCFIDVKVLAKGTSIMMTFTFRIGGDSWPWGPTFLARISEEVNFLNFRELDSLYTVCNLFHAENDGIGLFGKLGPSHMGILTFDESLQVIRRDSIFQWTLPEGNNGDLCHYFIYDMINSQAAMLPEGSYLISARLNEGLHHANGYPYNINDRSVILARYVNDFHQPENMIVTEHMNDSIEFPAFFRSLDFKETDETRCEVFQCSILNKFPGFGLLQPYPTGLVVTKTDQDLNLIWKKRYLSDGNYQAVTINATADGGCLVLGSFGDYQAQRLDVFALKINADGFVGLDEIKEESQAFVYPNPAKETIRIGGMEAKETQIFNTLGQCVMSFRGNEASVEALAPGVYLLKVTDTEGEKQTLRIVVTQ